MPKMSIGIGQAIFITPQYSYLPQLFQEKMQPKVVMYEIFTGLGLNSGAILSSLLFGLGGYMLPFQVSAFLMILTLGLIAVFIPNS